MVRGLWLGAVVVLGLLLPGAVRADGGPTRLLLPFVGYAEPAQAGVGSPYSDCTHILALGATWYQDWTPEPPLCDLNSRPLAMVGSWHGGELPEVPEYAWGIQLGNEVNLPGQGDMTVAETAELSWLARQRWPGRVLIAPVTFDDLYYVYQVYEEHERRFGVQPDWDVLAAHCYYPTAQACIEHVEGLLKLGRNWEPPLRVIVTEWAILPCSVTTAGVRGQPDITRAQAEAGKLRAWFEADERIVAHLWFGSEYVGDEWCVWQPHPACDTALMRGGTLTEWGRWWIGR